jgi:flagellar export protein FliJ
MAKFRLDRVIEIKNKIADDKKKSLEMALLALRNADEAIRSLDAALNEGYESMASPMGGSDFSVLRDFLFSLDARKAELLMERERINARLAVIRGELFELAKELRMLDTLKAKAVERERKLQGRREQKAMDAIALRSDERKP